MVLAVKQAWNGTKAAGAPNFSPLFFGSQNLGLGLQNAIQLRPGQYHTWVYAACTAIIQPAVDLPMVLYRKKDDKKLIEDHPLLDLMRKPNPFMSGTNFYEAIFWNLLLTTMRTPGGQAFVVGEKPTNFRKGEIPQELWVFGDDVMTPILDSQGILCGWKLGWGTGNMELNLDQVIRINLFNKYDWKQGLSPLAAAAIQVDQDAMAQEFNSTFLRNNASPGGMVSLEGAPPSPEIWKNLQTQFQQQYVGQQNAGKTLFMPWMLKFEQFARSHLDFAYMEQLNWNKESVLAAYRVNKWAVGDSGDLNYATAKEATRQLYQRAIIPLMRVVSTELSESWIRYIDKRDLRFKFDYSTVEALKEDRGLKIKDASVLIADGLPPSAAWEFVGLDIDTSPYAWLKENQSLGGQIANTLNGSPDNKPVPPNKPPFEAPKPPEKSLVVVTKDERENLSKFYIDKVFNPGEKELLPVVTKFLTSQRNSLQDLARDLLKDARTPSDLDAKRFKLKDEDTRIILAFSPILLNQAKRTLRQLRTEIPRKSLNLDSTEDEIRDFLKTRLTGLSEINDTSFAGVESQLSDIITSGIDTHQTMDELGKAIQDGIFDVYQGRLKTTGRIARTETATVTSGVRYEVFHGAGIQKQEWLTAHDARVRESHVEEDGHIVLVGEVFPITHLHYPCDEHGDADEVINCRCICLPVPEDK